MAPFIRPLDRPRRKLDVYDMMIMIDQAQEQKQWQQQEQGVVAGSSPTVAEANREEMNRRP